MLTSECFVNLNPSHINQYCLFAEPQSFYTAVGVCESFGMEMLSLERKTKETDIKVALEELVYKTDPLRSQEFIVWVADDKRQNLLQ